jgi:hypothetical protein
MQYLFNHFDLNKRGYLEENGILVAFKQSGKQLSTEEVREIFKLHDIDKNGKIYFEEFKLMFKELPYFEFCDIVLMTFKRVDDLLASLLLVQLEL